MNREGGGTVPARPTEFSVMRRVPASAELQGSPVVSRRAGCQSQSEMYDASDRFLRQLAQDRRESLQRSAPSTGLPPGASGTFVMRLRALSVAVVRGLARRVPRPRPE